MHPCSDHVQTIVNDSKVNDLIGKIKPVDLQDDLRQELYLAVLTTDCDKIIKLRASNELTAYVLKIVCNMVFSKTSKFYYQFRKSDSHKAIEYLSTLSDTPIIKTDSVTRYLEQKKTIDAVNWHEVTIFNKYVETNNIREVARFFEIPVNHVWSVINKIRNEIKSKCFTTA